MNRRLYAAVLPVLGLTVWAMAQTPGDPLIEGFRNVEVASVADAMEQLYGQKNYMSHDMRPIAKTKFAGPRRHGAVEEGGAQGRLEGFARHAGCDRRSAPGFGLCDGAGRRPGLRGHGRADVHGDEGARPDGRGGGWRACGTRRSSRRMQFPVFSRGIAPSTTINHYRFAGANIPVKCAGVMVNPGDLIVADEDGVAVVPKAKAAELLKKAQELDNTEHTMLPFIEKFKSIREAVAKFGTHLSEVTAGVLRRIAWLRTAGSNNRWRTGV